MIHLSEVNTMENSELTPTSTESKKFSDRSEDVSVDHHVNRNLMQDEVVNEVINEDELNHGAVLESKSDHPPLDKMDNNKQTNGVPIKNDNQSGSDELLPTNPDDGNSTKSSTKKATSAAKNRKKENLDDILKKLQDCSVEEKLKAVCDQFAKVTDENKQLKTTVKQNEKLIANTKRECDQLQSDLNKSIQTRNTLENLCRELQRQSKMMHEESLQKISEGEQKRKEITDKFQCTVNEITSMLKNDSDKTTKLYNDNVEMSAKLKSITDQYNLREQQVERMMKKMALETQLHEAKMTKLRVEFEAEKELLLREKQQLLVNLTEYQARCKEYQNIELGLRGQISVYSNKYEEFQHSLTHSNKVFTDFKEEIDKMSSKILKLESETAAWKQKWEKTQDSLVEMTGYKIKAERDTDLATKQMTALTKLCRILQQERSQLLKRLIQFDPSSNYDSKEVPEISHQPEAKEHPEVQVLNKEMKHKNNASQKLKQENPLPKIETEISGTSATENDKKTKSKNKRKSRANKNKNESEIVNVTKANQKDEDKNKTIGQNEDSSLSSSSKFFEQPQTENTPVVVENIIELSENSSKKNHTDDMCREENTPTADKVVNCTSISRTNELQQSVDKPKEEPTNETNGIISLGQCQQKSSEISAINTCALQKIEKGVAGSDIDSSEISDLSVGKPMQMNDNEATVEESDNCTSMNKSAPPNIRLLEQVNGNNIVDNDGDGGNEVIDVVETSDISVENMTEISTPSSEAKIVVTDNHALLPEKYDTSSVPINDSMKNSCPPQKQVKKNIFENDVANNDGGEIVVVAEISTPSKVEIAVKDNRHAIILPEKSDTSISMNDEGTDALRSVEKVTRGNNVISGESIKTAKKSKKTKDKKRK